VGGIEPFAFAHDLVVDGTEGADVVGAEHDVWFARRRA
jgi:hypothetical protein